MTRQEYFEIVKSYEKSNPKYSGLLYRIAQLCDGDFITLFAAAEKEGKKLFLKEDDDSDIISLEAIGIQ